MSKPQDRDLKAERIRAALLAIAAANDNVLNPQQVVDEARLETSPLHDEFEWDDDSAADAYRLAQAGALIRRVKITIMSAGSEPTKVKVATTRHFESLPSNRKPEGGYLTVQDIMSDEDKRAELLQQVLLELGAYRKRYAQLVELSDVWAALDGLLPEDKPRKRRGKPSGDDDRASA